MNNTNVCYKNYLINNNTINIITIITHLHTWDTLDFTRVPISKLRIYEL